MAVNKLVEELLRRFDLSWNEHLSDEKLADLICRELSFVEVWIAQRHLEMCRHCRSRRWCLEGPRAASMIELYAETSRAETSRGEDDELSEEPRAAFAQWLQYEVRRAALQRPERRILKQGRRLRAAMPAVSIGVAFGLTVGAIAFSLAWRRVPSISANSLLVHAEAWDVSASTTDAGVAHQTIRIKTSGQSMDRTLYWDLQGKRHAKRVALAGREEQLKLELGRAGVDWDRPISASAYQDWHDHQHVRVDRIAETGRHLLTLTTTVPDGILAQQSITVRDTDFHAVRRTVGFRDSDSVEIAELDYSVLPWSAVDAKAFEPLQTVPLHEAPALPHLRMTLDLPESRSPEQLDETELNTRLILNQLHADEDEQIEVRRSGQEVEVEGLVATDDRKRELTTQLMTVPGLKISIRSEADLSKTPPSAMESVSVEAAALPDNPSALDNYLRHRGRPVEEINAVERQLFEGALVISKESHFIAELKIRFAHSGSMPVLTLATLEELLYSHHERMEKALREERALLAQVQGVPVAGAGSFVPGTPAAGAPAAGAPSLAAAAGTNLALARELTQTNLEHPRSAEEIFAEMTGVLDALFPAAREAYMDREVNPAAGSKQ
ncbi:hypothetical protein HNQ77_003664 [Silvibacterium bohemicum]|uniref:Uncharacterized protein n=1 Tax=Silvibacterium bohemicum TaxID=1577686 RepID=A0A841JWC3_9BACT|nr:hypothetical protein [Silvibacterium bohemicum]MBB6145703.1 hypothetical protein [Silvibacterium bohemicum]